MDPLSTSSDNKDKLTTPVKTPKKKSPLLLGSSETNFANNRTPETKKKDRRTWSPSEFKDLESNEEFQKLNNQTKRKYHNYELSLWIYFLLGTIETKTKLFKEAPSSVGSNKAKSRVKNIEDKKTKGDTGNLKTFLSNAWKFRSESSHSHSSHDLLNRKVIDGKPDSARQTEKKTIEQKHKRSRSAEVECHIMNMSYAKSDDTVYIEGFLMKKNRNHRWKKRWVILRKYSLEIKKGKPDSEKEKDSKIISLQHSTVREIPGEDTAFEILAQDGNHYIFNCDSVSQKTTWFNSLQKTMFTLMNLALTDSGLSSSPQGNGVQPQGIRRDLLEVMMLAENGFCCECNSADPEWASLTFGCFICIQCSGVHRSLGREISAVKSAMLDSWEDESVEIMRKYGNKRVNSFWESNIPDTVRKPIANSSQEEKRKFIMKKYLRREFLKPNCTTIEINENINGKSNEEWTTIVKAYLESQEVQKHHQENLINNMHSPKLTRKNDKDLKKKEKDTKKRLKEEPKEKEPQSVYQYATNSNLLREAILFLLSEDQHFVKQVKNILSTTD